MTESTWIALGNRLQADLDRERLKGDLSDRERLIYDALDRLLELIRRH